MGKNFTEFSTTINSNGNVGPGPRQTYNFKLDWSFSGADVTPGDTFEFNIQCASIITPKIDLVSNGITVASCIFDIDKSFIRSRFTCKVLSTIDNDSYYFGNIDVPFTIIAGGAPNPDILACASRYQVGLNTISANDGLNSFSFDVNFQKGMQSGPFFWTGYAFQSADKGYYLLTSQSRSCPSGFLSGTIGWYIGAID